MTDFAEGYRNPTYVFEGARVIIPFKLEGIPYKPGGVWTGLRCKVHTACGDCARIINNTFGVDRWVKLEDMAVKDDNPMARSASQIAMEIQALLKD